MVTVRHAGSGDASGIARVKAAAWPEESLPDADYIACVMDGQEHVSQVAIDADGQVIGFVDGFVTLSQAGVSRWEVDLLAVHPDCRGRGIGRALVEANTAAGQAMGAAFARALIRVDNIGSQRVFARCGYRVDEAVCALYTSTQPSAISHQQENQIPPLCAEEEPQGGLYRPGGEDSLHLVPVTTFAYRGLWLEGSLGPDSFRAAQTICDHNGWDVAGAVIPAGQPETVRAAEAAGYAPVGLYQWWFFK